MFLVGKYLIRMDKRPQTPRGGEVSKGEGMADVFCLGQSHFKGALIDTLHLVKIARIRAWRRASRMQFSDPAAD